MVAFESGYAKSRPWFDEVMVYIHGNLDFVKSYIESYIDLVKVIEPEGTYLVWIDFRALNLGHKELHEFLVNEAKLGLDYGHWFGKEGAGFARMNIATRREILEGAMISLKNAVDQLKS